MAKTDLENVARIFQSAQRTTAYHRKYAVDLRKIQERYYVASEETAGEEEQRFNQEFVRNLNKVLGLRKRDATVERVIKFVATFMQYNAKRDEEEAKDTDAQMDKDEGETVSSRFIEYLVRYLLTGLQARERSVRMRCCQLLSSSIGSLNEIDEELYESLRDGLLDRLRDREASVRVQAAIALCRIQDEGDNEDQQSQASIRDSLLQALSSDPSAEVRRVIICNVDPAANMLSNLCERCRDIDPKNRRSVYAQVLSKLNNLKLIDGVELRQLLKFGLHDRDVSARQACVHMLSGHWLMLANNSLIQAKNAFAEEVLLALFDERPEIISKLHFNEGFWDNLTPENVFLAQAFVKHCQDHQRDDLIDEVLPELTRLAFIVEKYFSAFQAHSRSLSMGSDLEFIVLQLLEITKRLDYSDETGRRKMFSLLRQMLSSPYISEKQVASAVYMIRNLSPNERGFTLTMIEILSDLRDMLDYSRSSEERGFTGRTPSTPDPHTLRKKIKLEDAIASPLAQERNEVDTELKCLTIIRYTLENCQETLKANFSLEGVLTDYIIPAVGNADLAIREKGLRCLGLFSHLDRNLAMHNLALFMVCVESRIPSVEETSLMIIFDLILAHGYKAVTSALTEASCEQQDNLQAIFKRCVESDAASLSATAVEGVSKLLLCRMMQNEEVLLSMTTLYFKSSTTQNLQLRQCLSYVIPVYCRMLPENQVVMSRVTVSVIRTLANLMRTTGESACTVPLPQIMQILFDWTDPRKFVGTSDVIKDEQLQPVGVVYGIQADMAIDLLQAMLVEPLTTRKLLCQALPKLYLDEATFTQLKRMEYMMQAFEERKPFADAHSKKAWEKFGALISRLLRSTTSESEVDVGDLEAYVIEQDRQEALQEEEALDSLSDMDMEQIQTSTRKTKAQALEKLAANQIKVRRPSLAASTTIASDGSVDEEDTNGHESEASSALMEESTPIPRPTRSTSQSKPPTKAEQGAINDEGNIPPPGDPEPSNKIGNNRQEAEKEQESEDEEVEEEDGEEDEEEASDEYEQDASESEASESDDDM